MMHKNQARQPYAAAKMSKHPLRFHGPGRPAWTSALRLIALVLLLGLCVLPASANITLSEFKAAWQSDGSILITWETATEIDTQAFNLYRATSAAGPWDQRVDQQEARGDGFTGARYEYRDTAVTPGVRYYYLLEELTSAGVGDRAGPLEALLPGTPTATATATPTITATPTQAPTSTRTSTPAAGGGQPAATATQRYTNTPPPTATATATVPVSAEASPTATPLPPAAVATPTSSAFVSPLAPAPDAGETPTAQPMANVTPTATSTPVVAPPGPSPAATKTPLVFVAAGPTATLTPAAGPPAQARDTQRLLLFGGGAIVLAALLAAVAVFIVRGQRK